MFIWLTLGEAFRWVQVGFCIGIGFGIAWLLGYTLWAVFLALMDRA